jgi:chromosome transmission fidelity protein 18
MKLKQMVCRKAVIDQSTAASTCIEEKPRVVDMERKEVKRKTAARNNFLLIGAKNAKALRSARSAARVGCIVNSIYQNQSTTEHSKDGSLQGGRLSNTGSGMLLSQVVKLKYVKGFTQAVSMPCRADDLT